MKLARLWQPRHPAFWLMLAFNLLSGLLAWVTRSYPLTPVAALVVTVFAIQRIVSTCETQNGRIVTIAVQEIVPGATDQKIIPLPPLHIVDPIATIELIISRPSVQQIVPSITGQQVIPILAKQRIIPIPAEQHITANLSL